MARSAIYFLDYCLGRNPPRTETMNLLPSSNVRDQLSLVKDMVKVAVDVSKCNGDSICADVCPVAVFELQEVKGYDGKKSVVVNNDACIVCRACEVQCPTQAITVTE